MRTRRRLANMALKGLGLRHLSGSRVQKLTRSVLDEVDLQRLRDTFQGRSCGTRDELFEHVQRMFATNGPIDYLEFGVHTGDSLRKWTTLNSDPGSRFFGFDSFEGLPEDWRDGQGRGHFDVGGQIPVINDARVSFVKGWFNDTVPAFASTFEPRGRLVLHLDADLYSSSMWPLVFLTPAIVPGTILMFDEFYDREHEFKAYRDWLLISGRSGRIVAETDHLGKVAIVVE
jgi:O-methyltransferase